MSWKERFDDLINAGEQLGEFKFAICEHEKECIINFIEALIKETEQRVEKEIFTEMKNVKYFINGEVDLEQLREKYKGVGIDGRIL
jgi:hypothetical protein